MVYDDAFGRSDPKEDIAFRDSSTVFKSRIKATFNKEDLDDKNAAVGVDDSRGEQNSSRRHNNDVSTSRHGAVVSEIERLVQEAKAPDDFFDPLYLHLMKDPVVMSSGYIVDRSTILDRKGNLLFSRCPFSGKRLSSNVYPVQQKKKQIEHFRMKRDSNITQIACNLIAKGKFKSFDDVLDAIEVYMEGIGENHLPLVRELNAIWSSTHNPPSIVLLIDRLHIRPGNTWMTAVESGRIEEKVYKILVSVDNFRDERKGLSRSFLALSLYDDVGELVRRCKLFDHPHNTRSSPQYVIFGKQDRIVANAKMGYTYKLEYMIGSSPKYVQVEGLICKIIPSIDSMTSYQMRDADGEQGLYIRSTNLEGNVHGEGSFEYEDGKRFVGTFEDGSMVDGVLYRGSDILRTLKRGIWTRSIDEVLVKKYPLNMIVYDHSGSLPKPQRERKDDSLDDMPSHRSNHRSNYRRYDGHFINQQSTFDDTELHMTKKSLIDDECYSTTECSRNLDHEDMAPYGQSNRSLSSGIMKSRSVDKEITSNSIVNSDDDDDDDDGEFSRKTHRDKYISPTDDNRTIFSDGSRRDKSKEVGVESTFSNVNPHAIDGDEDRSISHYSSRSGFRFEGGDDEKLDKYRISRRQKASTVSRHHDFHGSDVFSNHSTDTHVSSNLSVNGASYTNNTDHSKSKYGHVGVSMTSGGLLSQLSIKYRPHIMHVPKLQKKLKNGGKWLPAAVSGYLEKNVKSLLISVDFFIDKKYKCDLAIALYSETGVLVARCIVFRSRNKVSNNLFQLITSDQDIVSKAKPGFFYQLQYAVNPGHQDTIQVREWICKIFTGGSAPLVSYYMADKEGDIGYYFGPVNIMDEAHGNGYLEYENGSTFVGTFVKGQPVKGVYYKVNQIQSIMKDKEWTREADRDLQRQYPQRLQSFKREVRSDDIEFSKNNDIMCARFDFG